MLRERMPRRFYCRARWQPSGATARLQVFDLDFVDRDGRNLGGIREFTVKRAPREALLRSLGGDATRMLYGVGWRETPPPSSGDAAGETGSWLVAGFAELAAELPNSVEVDDACRSRAVAGSRSRGPGLTARRYRASCCGPPGVRSAEESSTEFAARLESQIGNVLAAVHALLAEGTSLAGGLWVVTERAVATEAGEPVDPVQAALWGLGRTIIGEQPMLRCRLVDVDGSDDAVRIVASLLGAPGDEPELALRQGKLLVPRVLPWARSGYLAVPRTSDYVLAPTERGAIDNLRVTEMEPAPPAAGQVQVRVEAAGVNFRDVLNVLGLYPGDPGPVGGDFAGTVTAAGPDVTEFEVGPTGLRRVAGRDGQPGQRARPTARAGARSDRRDSGGEHTNGDADSAAGVRLGEAGSR